MAWSITEVTGMSGVTSRTLRHYDDEVDWHYRSLARLWTPNAAAYRHLGRMYVDDERFRANYERIAEGLSAYQRDAMAAYAEARLGCSVAAAIVAALQPPVQSPDPSGPG